MNVNSEYVKTVLAMRKLRMRLVHYFDTNIYLHTAFMEVKGLTGKIYGKTIMRLKKIII